MEVDRISRCILIMFIDIEGDKHRKVHMTLLNSHAIHSTYGRILTYRLRLVVEYCTESSIYWYATPNNINIWYPDSISQISIP